MQAIPKEPAQRHIEIISVLIWASLCISCYVFISRHFALSVLIGGVICMINFQWLYRHAKAAVTLSASSGKSFMTRRYILRLGIMAAVLYGLVAILKVNIVGLLLGLSVVIMAIVTYACYIYIFPGGE